jgi:hypothetical protein
MSALKLIKQTLARGGEHLGDLIWWSLAEARVERDAFAQIWIDAGLPGELLPDAPGAEKAFKAAVREAQVGQPGRLLRLAKDSQDELVFGVVREDRGGDGSLAYTQEARVALDRGREVVVTDVPAHELVIDIDRRFKVLKGTHVPDDVRRTLVRTLGSFAAVTLRPHGGVYWTPAPFAAHVRRLQDAVQRIGQSTVCVVPVHRSVEAEHTLGEVARGSIEEELVALRIEIEGFVALPPERMSTLERRLDAFEALRARARLYRDVLRVEVESLDLQLDHLTSTVGRLIEERTAA